MINMGDDCDVTNMVHTSRQRIGKMDACTRVVNEVYVQFLLTNEMSAASATDVFATSSGASRYVYFANIAG
jgi:hypothetical protein